jgi:hypothetical protein
MRRHQHAAFLAALKALASAQGKHTLAADLSYGRLRSALPAGKWGDKILKKSLPGIARSLGINFP